MQKSRKGVLAAVEGIDGSGKTTLVDALCKYLQNKGLRVTVFRFPTRDTPIGQLIDQRLRHKVEINKMALQFLFSGNRAEMQAKIQQAQTDCDVVLFDRYLDSAVAYAVAQGIDGAWIRTLDGHCIQPDLCLFLSLTPKTACERQKIRQETDITEAELYDNLDFQTKVHNAYCACYPADSPAELKASWATPIMHPQIKIERMNGECGKEVILNGALALIEKVLLEHGVTFPHNYVFFNNESSSESQ